MPFSLDIGTTERLEVNGQGGDDSITGAAGLDGLIKLRLDGGAGNDTITGGDGDDALHGGDGNDLLVGFRGDDRMFGGARQRPHGLEQRRRLRPDGRRRAATTSPRSTARTPTATSSPSPPNGDRVDFDRVNLVPFTLDIGTTERLEVNGQGGDDMITGGDGLDGLIKLRLDGGAGDDTDHRRRRRRRDLPAARATTC